MEVLWEDGERVLCRARRRGVSGRWNPVLTVLPAGEHPPPSSLARLAHEYELKDDLDGSWAVRPLEFVRDGGRTMLVLEDPGGEPLARLLDGPMDIDDFLRIAIGLAAALRKVHQRGLVHKDINPANILVNGGGDDVRLIGFGIASRVSRLRRSPDPPETITGTLAYMAPEQTGRMNRTVDSRSDFYALGVTFYQMLTGALPFAADDPMEWVHCHIARKPLPPAERVKAVPSVLSAITMKLLSKTAEQRYQTAGGLEHDLRRCLMAWEAIGRIHDFPLGEHDTPDQLLVPETLYGREREIKTLLAAFDRIAEGGAPELVLVSGYSGIGKSAVVRELDKVLVPPRGLFASGKFDQYKQDIPYNSLAQALQELIRPLLGKSEAELAPWREAFGEALDPNGQLMVTLVPELELLLGPQPPLPELPPQGAQRRFHMVFCRLLGVFARPERPLVLFLDDLQWLDAATLDLLEYVITQTELRHLLLIGAYRDNEVKPAHPLMRRLAAVRSRSRPVREIVLAPLGLEDLGRLVADALHCTPARSAPLARLVHEKTAGNPFFTIQFLTALAEEGLVAFDHQQARWSWDLDGIHAKGYTDNVVDLLLGKLRRLPDATREALQQLACLGNVGEIATLSQVLGESEAVLVAALLEAERAGLVFRKDGAYHFLHDRVREAGYALIPEGNRAAAHLAIGRRLAAITPPAAVEERVFEIVGHLNRGAALIASSDERERLAELNLIAGRRAKASTAYASALTYLTAGLALLSAKGWERRYQLTFALELHRAECEFLTGALGGAEAHLAELARRATSLPDSATVTRLQVDLFMTLARSDRAVAVGLDYLRRVGVAWSPHPTNDDVRQEYARLWRQLGDRSVDALIDLPRMTDPVACATMDVLTSLVSPALFTDENLRCLVIGRMGNLSLEHGNSDASCYAYTAVGNVLGLFFGDYKAAFRFGELGLDMAERSGVDRLKARVYLAFGNLAKPSLQHFTTGRPLARHAFDVALRAGDPTYAAFSCNNILTQLLAIGNPLAEVQREAEAGLDFARQSKFGLVVDLITAQFGLVRTLQGKTAIFGSFNGGGFDEARFEQHLDEDPRLSIAACLYWIRKLQARLFAGDYAAAASAATEAERLLWMSPAIFERAEYHLYAALARAALYDSAPAAARADHTKALAVHQRRLQEWAEHCPENFASRAALVGAEIARLKRRRLEAERLYDQAIRSARHNGLIHNEALAFGLAGRYYAASGLEINSRALLRRARQCYLSWGADAKVEQIDALYPHLGEDETAPAPTRSIGAPIERLDLATVIKVSQAVSGEIVLEKLIETVLRTAIEQAGAERGLLILSHGGEARITAEATTCGDTVVVQSCDGLVTAETLPVTVLHYVLRTKESVVLGDATAQNPFSADPYIRQQQARSVLCLPLLNQGQLTGVLYLENNLAPRIFASARIAVLKLLASQAAISLENSRLYRDRAESEAKIRRLVDANIIGIVLWNTEGRILEANDAFLRIVGYDREDLASGRLCWTGLTPVEWSDRDARTHAELEMIGAVQPFEKEYFRKDGSRVPVLIGGAIFEERSDEGVSFVLDLTERRRAEEALRESEQALREAQGQLAHANRVATMGQLTASIAHEVNQPIAASVTNAQAALRWLGAHPPNLEEVAQALGRIVGNANRAGEVIGRIRALVKKEPPLKVQFDLNEAVSHVIALSHGEVRRQAVSLRSEFSTSLPYVKGDRVQLQQVILNLIMNAIEAMSEIDEGERELRISTETETSGDVTVRIRDTGPGVDPLGMDRVFEAFYTTKSSGMGMGLSICRSIIEAHGGRLWVSANEPRGAVFQFTLPVDRDEIAGEEYPAQTAVSGTTAPPVL
ncbi:trifunctional serine/threonine-protein kinase/ATP-binding protein/sensor histidine kinase [Sinorhizobium sojae]|uniref:trifunctional serine/threonine-protein kinase/ATP-binding protein/sensor histidine kinase n=1 Tax=Sinorhizobium sojae TaxID=716925 RepID=UPI000550C0CC|nr:AAA family ATPase [Sinorhizobium sojae]